MDLESAAASLIVLPWKKSAHSKPGANPTIESYNAVKIYNNTLVLYL
jgi:hypothetical protein